MQTQIEITERPILVVEDEEPCWYCEAPTKVIDINFESRLCLNCYETAWREYSDAMAVGAGVPEEVISVVQMIRHEQYDKNRDPWGYACDYVRKHPEFFGDVMLANRSDVQVTRHLKYLYGASNVYMAMIYLAGEYMRMYGVRPPGD